MHLSWRARLEQQPRLRDLAEWPAIPVEALSSRQQRGFMRNQQVVACVLAGEALKAAARAHSLSPARVGQILDRCLAGEDGEAPALTLGLVPHANVNQRRRRRALPTHARAGGDSCAFRALLEAAPAVREGLDGLIEARHRDAAFAQRLTPHAVHGEFKRLLAELHWPRDRYPYTTASVAYQSVRRYAQRRAAELEQARLQRRRRATPRPMPGDPGHRALRAVQIDEHILDLGNRVHLLLNDELIPLRIARASVLVTIDVDTRCVLGYHLAPTRQPNQQDLLTLIDRCVRPWRPPSLTTPGLRYAPGACFPAASDEAFPISFGTVQLDNALMHQAHSIVDLLCGRFGATLSFGPPGVPTVRQRVEAVFDYLAQAGTHRPAATTGSHPTDRERESRANRKQPPVMTFQALDEALAVLLTEHNVTPQAALGDAAPLEVFRHHCRAHFVRFVPALLARQWHPLLSSTVVRLHWYREEHRRPHINFAYARYHGAGLVHVAGQETRVRVEFDRRDIRTLHAYTLAGADLGELQVSTPWQRFAHTLATRQWIHKNAARHRLGARDPLAAYFRYLLEHRAEPTNALSLLRVYTEFTGGRSSGLVLEGGEPTATEPARRHVWHPTRAAHRG
ncbi:hypothetical protein [Halofilum ochraceum]|uniref:hypothetical protein n=1 Tax=Halofilum ochraceum TaxID=1611323 RepID=UPI0008D9DA6C|nr:hypothetical protein [Halofilum ochraceum]